MTITTLKCLRPKLRYGTSYSGLKLSLYLSIFILKYDMIIMNELNSSNISDT